MITPSGAQPEQYKDLSYLRLNKALTGATERSEGDWVERGGLGGVRVTGWSKGTGWSEGDWVERGGMGGASGNEWSREIEWMRVTIGC